MRRDTDSRSVFNRLCHVLNSFWPFHFYFKTMITGLRRYQFMLVPISTRTSKFAKYGIGTVSQKKCGFSFSYIRKLICGYLLTWTCLRSGMWDSPSASHREYALNPYSVLPSLICLGIRITVAPFLFKLFISLLRHRII